VSSARTDALNADTDSVAGTPLHELWRATRQSGGSGWSDAYACAVAPLQRHAYSDQVLLLQLEQLTLAAPAAPAMLQQMHQDLKAAADPSVPVALEVPLWMQDWGLVQQLIDSSNSVVCSSCVPAVASSSDQQPQQPRQQASQASATTAGAPVSGAVPAQEILPDLQPQQRQAPVQAQRPTAAAGSSSWPQVGMRHGILLLPEDASLTLTAAPAAPQLRHLLSATTVKEWFRRQVAKVTPRRLVIRPGEAQRLAAAAAAGERAAQYAAARARAGAVGGTAAAAATLSAHRAAAAGFGPAGSGAVALSAYCLLDFQQLELLAGRMGRVQVSGVSVAEHSCRSASGLAQSSVAGNGAATSPVAPRASGGSLVGLTHMITQVIMGQLRPGLWGFDLASTYNGGCFWCALWQA
jgi:hypothetical protein